MIRYYTSLGVLFAVASAPQEAAEWRLDGDEWVALPTFPVLRWLLDGDARLGDASLPDGVEPPPFRFA